MLQVAYSSTRFRLRESNSFAHLPFTTLFPDDFRVGGEILGIKIEFESTEEEVGKLVIALCRSQNNLDAPIGYVDFNRVTGAFMTQRATLITNEGTDWTYGVTFSPDGNLVYLVDYINQTLRQYEFATGRLRTIGRSTQGNRSGGLLLGPDNRIYWSNNYINFGGGDITRLARINRPNEIGQACNLEYNAVNFSGGSERMGVLPRFRYFSRPYGSL